MVATARAFKDIVPTGFRPKMKKVVAEGDAVVLEFEGDAVLSNGEPYCNQYVFVFSFENGKIKQLNEYFCTVLADKVMLPLLTQKGAEYAQGDANRTALAEPSPVIASSSQLEGSPSPTATRGSL